MSQQRVLAAIMFTDIVGYTALMGKDSNKAMELVRLSKDIQKPLVEKHQGKWIKEMGDGAIAQFNTALDAVNCAVEIQRTSRADFEEDIRIGIHLGDITIEDGDVYGDGVNVACRLESIADPGGIYISESIEKAIQGQSDIQAKYLGEVKLKNVAYGVRTYAVQGVGLPIPEVGQEKQLSGHLWAELQRRGVLRAGATYIVLSLLAILLLPYTESIVNLPQWSATALPTILIVGFSAAMYLAWNYERSPEGFVRTSSEQSWQNPYSVSQRKPLTSNVIIIGLILVIVIMYLYPRLVSVDPNQRLTESTLEAAVRDKSIAVLPFMDMSPNKDQEYFSDGIMEEILSHLIKIRDLQVTSRTSVMRYKGTTKPISEIAKELGVTTILEGSVRTAGDRVRITLQLIDGRSDKHLWAETYDRKLDDIFAIQTEVAERVASTLQAEINPEVRIRIETQPTSSIDAYNLFLRARHLFRYGTDDQENRQAAIQLLEEAISIDSEFASAYVMLGFNKSAFTWTGYSLVTSSKEAVAVAMPYYEKALELDPNNMLANSQLALLRLWYQWDFEAADKQYRILKKLNPSHSWADFLIAAGRFEEAAKEAEMGVRIDPLLPGIWAEKIISLYFTGKHDEAVKIIDEALNLHANTGGFIPSDASRVYLYLGMYEKVIETIQHLPEIS